MKTTIDRSGSARVTLPSDTEILIERDFDAPAELLFAVWTDPEHVRNWWGFPDHPMIVCEIDLRVGGSWRYVVEHPDAGAIGWHGIYREIERPGRLVSTEVFEGYPDGESLNYLTLAERDGVTTMSVRVVHQTKENRDGHVNSGMEGGMQVSLNRIDEILASLQGDAE